MSQTTELVDAGEICRGLRVCRKTLATMVKDGRFPPPLRIGLRKKLWLRVTVDEHFQQANQTARKQMS